jgi:hypothetical protein
MQLIPVHAEDDGLKAKESPLYPKPERPGVYGASL